jgi:CSLREA domain-containing protein
MKAMMKTLGALFVASVFSAAPAAAATFTVNSNGDAGDASPGNGTCATSGGGSVCTLRAAIQEANAFAGTDIIRFAIGSGPVTINTASLPAITQAVTIDGTTQPGWVSAPIVQIRGGSGNGFKITGSNVTIRGFVVSAFADDGISIGGGTGNVVEGCYVGTNMAGSAADGNAGAGVAITSSNNRIGGREKAQRNVISGNTGKGNDGGVWIGNGAEGNIVQGNFIGSDATGIQALGNEGRGVAIHDGSNNFIGGALAGAGNLVVANRATGIRVITGTGNLIMGNWIGLNAAGQTHYGIWPDPGVLSNARGVQLRSNGNFVVSNIIASNTFEGVLIFDGDPTGNLIQGNVLAYNGTSGVGAYYGHNTRITGNSIFGSGLIGIELGPQAIDGVTPNDPMDADSGPNNNQNYPDLSSATANAGSTGIVGVLNSAANTSYVVEFFASPSCDPSGYGEGQNFLGAAMVSTNAAGTASFAIATGAAPAGWFATSTATDPAGNTSEFSACTQIR